MTGLARMASLSGSLAGSVAWASYQISKIAGCTCAGNAGNVPPPPPPRQFQRKPLVSDPGMYHGTCVMHVGIACMRWRRKRSRHSRRMRTRNFAYLAHCLTTPFADSRRVGSIFPHFSFITHPSCYRYSNWMAFDPPELPLCRPFSASQNARCWLWLSRDLLRQICQSLIQICAETFLHWMTHV